MVRRMMGKEHNVFTNAVVLGRFEKLMKNEKKRFEELGVINLVELLRHCTVSEPRLGSMVVAIHPMDRREQFHRIFDTSTEKRKTLEDMLQQAKVQQKQLSHKTPLSNITLNDLGEMMARVQDFDALIVNLQGQLNALPKRNGVTDNTFNTPTMENLIDMKLVKIDGHDTFLTSRGEKVVKAAQNSFALLRGYVERQEWPKDEELLEMYGNIKSAMKKRLI